MDFSFLLCQIIFVPQHDVIQRLHQLLRRLKAPVRVFPGTFADNVIHAFGDLQLRKPFPDRADRLRIRWNKLPRQQPVHRGAETVNIRAGIRVASCFRLLLRRGVFPCFTTAGGIPVYTFPGLTKVNQLQIAFGHFQNNVAGFQIMVDDGGILRVQINQHIANLFSPFHRCFLRNRPMLFQLMGQRLARNVIHDNVGIVQNVHNTRNRRVIKGHHQTGFLQHTVFGRCVQFTADFLDNPLLIQLLIHRQIDQRGAALANLFDNFIFVIQYCPNRQHSIHLNLL